MLGSSQQNGNGFPESCTLFTNFELDMALIITWRKWIFGNKFYEEMYIILHEVCYSAIEITSQILLKY
jgi:hypothetical protein